MVLGGLHSHPGLGQKSLGVPFLFFPLLLFTKGKGMIAGWLCRCCLFPVGTVRGADGHWVHQHVFQWKWKTGRMDVHKAGDCTRSRFEHNLDSNSTQTLLNNSSFIPHCVKWSASGNGSDPLSVSISVTFHQYRLQNCLHPAVLDVANGSPYIK